MGKSRQWFERFFDGVYGKVLDAQFDRAQSQKQAALAKRLARMRRGHHVLDIPCGQGRLTIPLAAMGLNVTGVDQSKTYLARARKAAREVRVSACFRCRDMRCIEFDRQFDAAFNWFGSFGYFSDDENLDLARRIFAALKPGGRFLVEGVNKSWLARNFSPRGEQTINGVPIRNSRKWNTQTDRILDTWALTYRGRTRRHLIDLRIYDGPSIRSLQRNSGFRDIELFAYPKAGRFTRHSARWIAVARKPPC